MEFTVQSQCKDVRMLNLKLIEEELMRYLLIADQQLELFQQKKAVLKLKEYYLRIVLQILVHYTIVMVVQYLCK
jgi:hypothetical protein